MSNVELCKQANLLSQTWDTEWNRLEHKVLHSDSAQLWWVLLIYVSYSWFMLVSERSERGTKTVKLHTWCHIAGSLIKYLLFTV